jgi:GxxExxY protein
MNEEEYNKLSEKIIGCAYTVANKLGYGFLEKVYENSLLIELRKEGITAEQQVPIKVYYGNISVGDYYMDIFIENEIIVELKTVKIIDTMHMAQLLNYLKGTQKKLGLIINFSKPRVQIKRVVNNL